MRGPKRWRRVGRQLPLTLGSRPLCSSEFPLTRRYVCGLCIYVLIIIIFSFPILSYRSCLVVLFCVWSRFRCGAHRFVMVVSTRVVSSSLALPILFGALGCFGGISSGWGHGGLRKPIGHHGISAYTEEFEHFRWLVCHLVRCLDVAASIFCGGCCLCWCSSESCTTHTCLRYWRFWEIVLWLGHDGFWKPVRYHGQFCVHRDISDGWISPFGFYFWLRCGCGGIDLLWWCRRFWFLRVLTLVTFGGHGFWLGHDGLCNFCVQRRTRTFSDGWCVIFSSPLFAIFRFVSKFVGSPSLSPWRRRRFWGVSCGWDMVDYGSAFGSREIRICRETRTFSDAYCSAATASRELRRVKRIWSTNRVGGLSSPLLVVVVVVASIVVVSKFVGSPCVFESFTTHSLFVLPLPHVWCP